MGMRIEHVGPMVEALLDDSLDGIVVFGFDRAVQVRVVFCEFLQIALKGATEGHHIYLLAVRADNTDFLANDPVGTFPDRYFAAFAGASAIRRAGLGASRGFCSRALAWLVMARSATRIWRGYLQWRTVVVFLFEELGDGTEIQQEEVALFVLCIADYEGKTSCSPP